MNIYLIYPDEVAPCYPGKAGAGARPVSGPSKKQDTGGGSRRRGKPNLVAAHPKPSWVMRTCSALWPALAIALSLLGSPLRADFAYVPNQGDNTVSGYTIDPSTGALTALPASFLFNVGANVPRSVVVVPNGKFLYVAGFNGVKAYTRDQSTGAVTGEISGSPFAAGLGPISMAVFPNGKFLYVANNGDATVSAFTIDRRTGALTVISGSTLPTGSDSRSVAVDPSGNFAYAAVQAGVLGFTIDPRTGALTVTSVFGSALGPDSVAVDPSGKFAYAANVFGNDPFGTVSAFTINAATGALTPITSSPFAAGSLPVDVAVDPSGKFVYVANLFGNNVSGYTINPKTGALTAISGSPFAAGSGPSSVAFATN